MSSDKLLANILPPCRICGSKASGLHYGVNTCEACKAFFRRSLDKGHLFECPDERSCKVDYKSRSTCPYCRFQKCISLGMCKEAIKTGRYSHELKASNIQEIKYLEAAEKKSTTNLTDGNDSILSNMSVDIEANSTAISLDNNSSVVRDSVLDSGANTGAMLLDNNTTCFLEDNISNIDESSNMKNFNEDFENDEMYSDSSDEHSNILISSERKLYDTSKVESYEEVIQRLCDVHKKIYADYMSLNVVLKEKENECLEMVNLREQIFGPLKPVPVEEYVKFYEETGIDIDGRRELLEATFLPNLEHAIRQQISFAKIIPGFVDLSVAEQIDLIKASRLDYFIVGGHRWFNPQDKLLTFRDGKIVHISEMLKLADSTVIESSFNFQYRIKKLNMSVEETVIVCSLGIMCPDCVAIESREIVEKSQAFLLECLFYILNKSCCKEKLRFARMISCLTQMRTLRDEYFKGEEQMTSIWWGIVNFPPLLYEVLDYKPKTF